MAKTDDESGGTSPMRDDHQAALDRADALQRELDEERAKGTENKERLDELAAQLAEAKAKLKALGADEPPSPVEEAAQAGGLSAMTQATDASTPMPPTRASQLSLEQPNSHPDDGPLSSTIRKVDNGVGLIEQALLFALLIAIVLTASIGALSDRLFHHQFGGWSYVVLRGGTFSIAMLAAAFATHQQRHLAMDLVSRRLTPRGRLVLGSLLKIFTIAIAALLFRSGMHQRDHVGGIVEQFISDKSVVTMLPIGCALIILHSLLHIVIDVDYLARGKLPPEKARSAH